MQGAQRYALWLGMLTLAAMVMSYLFVWQALFAPLATAASILVAFGFGSIAALRSYQYTLWIIAALVCGLLYPSAFLQWGEYDLRNPWLILIVVQVIMFGMGTQMSYKDFSGIRTMGKGVFVGIVCQFSIMPVAGYLLTRVFAFEGEIAAGIILIGSCSSGLASNVMVYLARANLALSVTLTAVATLLAPIMTPFLMKILAGTYVEIRFLDMCVQIVKIVVVPIGAAFFYDLLTRADLRLKKSLQVYIYTAISWLLFMILGGWDLLDALLPPVVMTILEVFNFLCGALVVGKVYYHLLQLFPRIQGLMPILSMFGIVYFTLVTTAASRDNILTIGLFMLLACILHNTFGYTAGYWISRAVGLDKDSARTVALEVGLQNGGMASGLAGVMGKLATLGLASAIFSPWMNISGSMLANYWKKKDAR